ncbi:hypothetical protein AAG570_011919 [Ranatra chinensis]|uniref:Uncharacterized protein n=1 Tax=Ranatra chinensis TaxID=642074 RepID=A0ABD0YTQ7_9HEMI
MNKSLCDPDAVIHKSPKWPTRYGWVKTPECIGWDWRKEVGIRSWSPPLPTKAPDSQTIYLLVTNKQCQFCWGSRVLHTRVVSLAVFICLTITPPAFANSAVQGCWPSGSSLRLQYLLRVLFVRRPSKSTMLVTRMKPTNGSNVDQHERNGKEDTLD